MAFICTGAQIPGMTARPPFESVDFLTLADQLANDAAGGEAGYRCALSRCYYAAFLKARETLAASGTIGLTRTGLDHGIVIQRLRAANRSTGDQLDKLRRKRTRADYDLAGHVGQREAQQTVAITKALWPGL